MNDPTLYQYNDTLLALLAGWPIESGAAWIRSVFIDKADRCGWAHLSTHDIPTVWGGTLDALRGLLAAEMSPYDPLFRRGVDWLFSQQRPDGGWGSREITYSAVEATAWVVFVLRHAGFDVASDERTRRAILFLESAIGPGGELATSPQDHLDARTYPAHITLLALHDLSPRAAAVARYLRDAQNDDGGWGIKENAPSNALSTAQVLDALLLTRHLNATGESGIRALRWLSDSQQQNGSWLNFSEQWFSVNQPTVPNRCDSYTTASALRALLHAGCSAFDQRVLAGAAYLIREQDSEGCWYYNRPDGCKHVWCTADAIDALAQVRDELKHHRDEVAAIVSASPVIPQRSSRFALGLAVVFAIVAAIGFRREVAAIVRAALVFLRLQASNLTVNLMASVIYALAASLVVLLWRYVRAKGRA